MSSDRLIYGELLDNPPRTSTEFADLYTSIMSKYDLYSDMINNQVSLCKNGLHPMEGDNLLNDRGYTTCKTCRNNGQRDRNRARRARERETRQQLVDSRS